MLAVAVALAFASAVFAQSDQPASKPESSVVPGGGTDGGTSPPAPVPPAKPPTYSITVSVSGAIKSGVDLELSGSNGAPVHQRTSASGECSFTNIPDGTYTVSPELKGYVFTPTTQRVIVAAGNTTAWFQAKALLGDLRHIVGTVIGAAPSAVTIALTGANTATVTTTASGSYDVPRLARGKYTLTPSAPGFIFTPNSVAVAVDTEDGQQNFVGMATQCTPPTVTFRWVGTHGAYMTTNPKFAPTDLAGTAVVSPPPATPSTPASPARNCSEVPESPSIRILGRDGQCLTQVKNVKNFRHCGSDDTAGCLDQVYPVAFDKVPNGSLVENGYRVSVEFTGLLNCSGQVRVEDVVVLEQHHLAVDVGSSFGLNAAGSFVSHLELALNANSRWTNWFFGDVDLRLSMLEETSSPDQQVSLKNGSHMTLDATGRALFVLKVVPSGLRVTTQEDSYQPWFVPVLGAGLRSLAPGTVTDVRYRFLGGVRLQVLGYNAGEPAENFGNTRGFVEVGYSRDQFWRETNENRIYTEGQIEIPSIGSKWLRFLVRMKIDRGIGPPGDPSEVRISVLSSINPSTLGALLGFSPKK